MRLLTKGTIVALAATLTMTAGLSAANAQGYYEGKVVNFIVPHQTSGLYGQYAQLMGPYIAKALGAAEVRIDHKTGAGGLVGSNLVWLAPPDGLTFGLSSGSSLMIAQLAGGEGVNFDATKFTYLGRPTADDRVITVGKDSPIKTFDDVLKLGRPFVVPSQGTDEDFYAMAIASKALGFETKFLTGYEGNADTTLAVIKGDGDGHMNSWPSSAAQLQSGDKRAILNFGKERHPDYPDVPTAFEYAKTDEAKKLLETLVNIQSLHRTFFGPAGIPDDVTKELRDGIWSVLTNPEVIDAAIKLQSPLKPMKGEEQQVLVQKIYDASGDIPPIH
jgi:tripartite-type tricarboxylate transporter receptor subunit TctC